MPTENSEEPHFSLSTSTNGLACQSGRDRPPQVEALLNVLLAGNLYGGRPGLDYIHAKGLHAGDQGGNALATPSIRAKCHSYLPL